MRTALKYGFLALFITFGAVSASAETKPGPSMEKVKGEELSSAIGHYSRARALLIAAVKEFDDGRKFANPDIILDSGAWRSTVIDRAEDLERVLAPQAKASKSGIKFEAYPELLTEAGSN